MLYAQQLQPLARPIYENDPDSESSPFQWVNLYSGADKDANEINVNG